MKLEKINLNELANAELNEREMCHILGGGTPGCCQCGCNYTSSGGSSTSSNNSANNAGGLTSDPGADPCPTTPPIPDFTNYNPITCPNPGWDRLCQ